jgi:hypothetical protein
MRIGNARDQREEQIPQLVDWRTDPQLVAAEARLTAADHEVLRLEARVERTHEAQRQRRTAISEARRLELMGAKVDLQRLLDEFEDGERDTWLATRAVETAIAARDDVAAAIVSIERAAKARAHAINERTIAGVLRELYAHVCRAAELNVQMAALMGGEGWIEGSACPYSGLPVTLAELVGHTGGGRYGSWVVGVRDALEAHELATAAGA